MTRACGPELAAGAGLMEGAAPWPGTHTEQAVQVGGRVVTGPGILAQSDGLPRALNQPGGQKLQGPGWGSAGFEADSTKVLLLWNK